MKRVNQFAFFEIGSLIHPIIDIADGTTVGTGWYPCLQALRKMEALLANDLTPLVTCRTAATEFAKALQGFVPDWRIMDADAIQTKMAEEMSPYALLNLRAAANRFETVFAAELETTDTYYVSKKGIYSTNDLIERAEEAFSTDVRAELSVEAIQDIQQAGKCLAFDLHTASGFHIIRATETIIHRYYIEVTGSSPRRKDRNWGAYVRNLTGHKNKIPGSRVDPKLISLIDQAREHHRNPVMHPEVKLTEDEALSLFNISQSIIIAFASALKGLSPAQLTLVAGAGGPVSLIP